jgi:hypothetical protein
MKLSFGGGDSGGKKCTWVWQVLCLMRNWSLESGCRFCIAAFGMNLGSVEVKMFTRFNVICKENVAVNFITV